VTLAGLLFLGLSIASGRRKRAREIVVSIGEAVIEPTELVDIVEAEAAKWVSINERSPEAAPLLEKYWRASGRAPNDDHWSGAFIVWAANAANPHSLVEYPQHSAYAFAHLNGRPGYRTIRPSGDLRAGDIVLKPRPGDVRTFDELTRPDFAPFPSHGDIVTEVHPDRIVAIGGNKAGDRVAAQTYRRRPDGTVPEFFAVLRLEDSRAS